MIEILYLHDALWQPLVRLGTYIAGQLDFMVCISISSEGVDSPVVEETGYISRSLFFDH